MEITEYILRLSTAFVLGGIIGFERQWHQKNAGLRTNTLVAIGAASFVLLSVNLHELTGGDLSRITAQIVTGIGFIGAGVIMKDGFNVRGLNTAATIWCSAAVGTLAGMGFVIEALLTTIAVVLSHVLLRPISNRLAKISAYRKNKVIETYYRVFIKCGINNESNVRGLVLTYIENNDQLLLRSINRETKESRPNKISISIEIASIGKKEILMENLVMMLTKESHVILAGWEFAGEETEY